MIQFTGGFKYYIKGGTIIMAQKRTPNQIEFERQVKRIGNILKRLQAETGVDLSKHKIEQPKRVTKQKIRELKEITPKVLKSAIELNTPQPIKKQTIEATGKRRPAQYEPTTPRNRSLEAIIRNAKRGTGVKDTVAKKKRTTKTRTQVQPKEKVKRTRKTTQDTNKTTQRPDKAIFDKFSEEGKGGFVSSAKISAAEDTPITPINETEQVIDTIYELLHEWVFNIEDAHEGYEDVKRADRDLVWAIIGRARAELGDEQVALNIRNSGTDVEGIINRIIYGSDETTVRFDIAELTRIVNGRALSIDESIYLTELFENRAYIEFDEEDFETDNPYFATLKGFDE